MARHRTSQDDLETVINYLSDSLLESDSALSAETRDLGLDPEQEGERTRDVLRGACQALEFANRRLCILGHAVDSNWEYRRGEYHNTCANCGADVSFSVVTHASKGAALQTGCSASRRYTATGRGASRG